MIPCDGNGESVNLRPPQRREISKPTGSKKIKIGPKISLSIDNAIQEPRAAPANEVTNPQGATFKSMKWPLANVRSAVKEPRLEANFPVP